MKLNLRKRKRRKGLHCENSSITCMGCVMNAMQTFRFSKDAVYFGGMLRIASSTRGSRSCHPRIACFALVNLASSKNSLVEHETLSSNWLTATNMFRLPGSSPHRTSMSFSSIGFSIAHENR
jgi:hypothetical protein